MKLLKLVILIIISSLGIILNVNAAVIDKSGTISVDETWTSTNTYNITGDLTLNNGINLTIQAGTVVKLGWGVDFTVSGNIQAIGTSGNKIYFTAKDNDSVGEIISGSDGIPTKGDWGRMQVTGAGASSSVLQYIDMSYGGRHSYYGSSYKMLEIYNTNASLLDSTISNSVGDGIYLSNGSPVIRNNTFSDNNYNGAMLYYGSPTFENNNFTNNVQSGFYCKVEISTFFDNSFSGNGEHSKFCTIDALVIENPTRTTYSDTLGTEYGVASINLVVGTSGTLPKLSKPLVLLKDSTLDSGKTLTIQAGNIIKPNFAIDLTIKGNLQVIGTVSEPVVITSLNDDTVGGSVTGSTGTPNKGDWGRIQAYGAGSNSTLFENVILNYGGRHSYYGSSYKTLEFNNTTATINNSVVKNSIGDGIYVYGGNIISSIQNTIVSDNAYNGIKVHSSLPLIDNVSLIDNTLKGLECKTEVTGFTNNSFSGNGEHSTFCTITPLLQENPSNITYLDTSGTHYEVGSLNIVSGISGTLPKLDKSILITNDAILDSGKTLIIDGGNVFKLGNGIDLTINGNLQAIGTELNPIIFTSINDDTVGSIIPTSTSTPAKGNWGKIKIYGPGSNSTLIKNVIFNYGGLHSYYGSSYKLLEFNNTTATIQDSIIKNSIGDGLYLYSGAGNVKNNIFLNNNYNGVYINSGINIVQNNTLISNLQSGIHKTVSATNSIIKNNIIYDNTYGLNCASVMGSNITYNLIYNNSSGVQNGSNCTLGSSNITLSDPLFINFAGGDYNLQSSSSAINAGDPALGNHPISGNLYDIGAKESLGGTIDSITAVISNPELKPLTYTWSFISDPSGGLDIPGFTEGESGAIITETGSISVSYLLKYVGNYNLKLSISNSGSVVKEGSYSFIVNN